MNKRCLLALVLATEEFRQHSSMALLSLITHACLERRHRAVVPTCRRLAWQKSEPPIHGESLMREKLRRLTATINLLTATIPLLTATPFLG